MFQFCTRQNCFGFVRSLCCFCNSARRDTGEWKWHGDQGSPRGSPKNVLGGGHTGSVAKSGRRPAPTPRAYRGERWNGQAPCYAVKRTVSPVLRHSPVGYIAAPRIGRVGIEPGAMKPAQRIWSPVHLLGPGYMAPALRMAYQVCQHSPVRSIPPRRTGLTMGCIQPGRVV